MKISMKDKRIVCAVPMTSAGERSLTGPSVATIQRGTEPGPNGPRLIFWFLVLGSDGVRGIGPRVHAFSDLSSPS